MFSMLVLICSRYFVFNNKREMIYLLLYYSGGEDGNVMISRDFIESFEKRSSGSALVRLN